MSMNLLVVEDDDGNLRLALRMLRIRPDIIAYSTCTGEQCLEIVQQTTLDCILLDIGLPGMDGVETCRRLRAMPCHAAMRIIACTAHASDEDQTEFLKIGFDAVLTKPFLVEELLESLTSPNGDGPDAQSGKAGLV